MDWLHDAASEIEQLSLQYSQCGLPLAEKLAALLIQRLSAEQSRRLLSELQKAPQSLEAVVGAAPDTSIGLVHFIEKARFTLAFTKKGGRRLEGILFALDSEIPQEDDEAVRVVERFFGALSHSVSAELLDDLRKSLPRELRRLLPPGREETSRVA